MTTTVKPEPRSICCPMRAHYLIGIVAEAAGPAPVEAVDFIRWDVASPKPIIQIKFCPFCGTTLSDRDRLRVSA